MIPGTLTGKEQLLYIIKHSSSVFLYNSNKSHDAMTNKSKRPTCMRGTPEQAAALRGSGLGWWQEAGGHFRPFLPRGPTFPTPPH